MDPLAALTGAASAIAPVLVPLGTKCLSFRNKAIKDHKITGLALPPSSGKTELARNLNGSDIFVIDIDGLVMSKIPASEHAAFAALKVSDPMMYDIQYKRTAKHAVDELKHDFMGSRRLLLLASSLSVLEFVGVKRSNMYAMCPSLALHNATHSGDLEERRMRLMEARNNFILDVGRDNIRIFDSWEALTNIVRASWGLQSRL